ncbi:hypothetical protein DICPUDRAFT_159084 [Dictyostelium purpureum]|uniref:CCHC-type domain-containing protein n=1 Tax=Dictyostelium purpureum TaxID=5786 RepID=F1A387_DICPU|nr:uncharacterized protein DICPUDRAFT_159084 [Dictyostelium purpureum]EGC29341.1 hypothetical protein DICPUDRAFT_159084 [Dictyostelium purpureum]|eukprot:XP_003294131.1 hypothetical protein DICPUDRAFT_159084 [Dictyostelium purpureum]
MAEVQLNQESIYQQEDIDYYRPVKVKQKGYLLFNGDPNTISFKTFKLGLSVMYDNKYNAKQIISHLDKRPLETFLNFYSIGGSAETALNNLETLYAPVEEAPISKLLNFHKRKFSNFEELILEFNQVECVCVDVPVPVKVDLFIKSLPDTIRLDIIKTAPKTLKIAYENVRQISRATEENYGYSLMQGINQSQSLPPSFRPESTIKTSLQLTSPSSSMSNFSNNNSSTSSVNAINFKRNSNVFCHYCRKPGHVVNDCNKLKNKKEKEIEQSKKENFSQPQSVNAINCILERNNSVNSILENQLKKNPTEFRNLVKENLVIENISEFGPVQVIVKEKESLLAENISKIIPYEKEIIEEKIEDKLEKEIIATTNNKLVLVPEVDKAINCINFKPLNVIPKKESIKFTNFNSHFSLDGYLSIPFGLVNFLSICQSKIQLSNHHAMHLKFVFGILRDAAIKLKLEKYEIARKEIKFLDYKISEKGVSNDGNKHSNLLKTPVPSSKKQLTPFVDLFKHQYEIIYSPSKVNYFINLSRIQHLAYGKELVLNNKQSVMENQNNNLLYNNNNEYLTTNEKNNEYSKFRNQGQLKLSIIDISSSSQQELDPIINKLLEMYYSITNKKPLSYHLISKEKWTESNYPKQEIYSLDKAEIQTFSSNSYNTDTLNHFNQEYFKVVKGKFSKAPSLLVPFEVKSETFASIGKDFIGPRIRKILEKIFSIMVFVLKGGICDITTILKSIQIYYNNYKHISHLLEKDKHILFYNYQQI